MDLGQLRFASRFDQVTGSAIREIFKVIAQPGMISFAGGNPSPDALPDALVSELSSFVLEKDGKNILQYGATEGYRPFVESLKGYVESMLGVSVPAVLPVTGGEMRMHDGWFALIAAALGRIGFIELPTMLYRQHGDNVVGAKDVRSLRYIASFAERLRDNRASIRQCQEQAGALLATFGDRLTERQKAMLADFAELPGRGKWRRLSVVSRYHIWLYGRRRKLAEILLI